MYPGIAQMIVAWDIGELLHTVDEFMALLEEC